MLVCIFIIEKLLILGLYFHSSTSFSLLLSVGLIRFFVLFFPSLLFPFFSTGITNQDGNRKTLERLKSRASMLLLKLRKVWPSSSLVFMKSITLLRVPFKGFSGVPGTHISERSEFCVQLLGFHRAGIQPSPLWALGQLLSAQRQEQRH